MRNGLILALLLMTAPLAGCLALEDEDAGGDDDEATKPDPNLTTDPAQLAKGNNVLYLHSEGTESQWMDLDKGATDTALTGTVAPGSEEQWWMFPLKTESARVLNMTGEPASLEVRIASQGTLGTAPDVKARLTVDGKPVSTATAQGHISGTAKLQLEVPDSVAAGSPMEVAVCVCPSQVSLSPQYTLYTDGSSRLILPIATPIFDDGSDAPGDDGASGGSAGGDRSETAVRTYQEGGRWHAEKTVTMTGGMSLNKATLKFTTVNGDVDVSGGSSASYEVKALLKGQGDSEQAARARLDALVVDHSDDVSGDAMALATQVKSKDQWRNQTGELTVSVPSSIAYSDVDLGTVNGDVSAHGLDGGVFALSTTNGDVTLTGAKVTDIDMSTDNGRATADVESTASGTFRFDVVNGNVDLTVPDGSDFGYDAQGETVNGQVTIDLAGTEPVGTQSAKHKHERTTDYDARAVKVDVTATTINGSVEIQGA